ncbi:MAG: hypothetical protein JNK82_39870 [Myxococcaceae bacterium]|nr:hypothetical protein [Myxococcaceae bacterium]
MTGVQLFAASSGGRIGTISSVVVAVFEGPAEPAMLDSMERVNSEAAARWGKFTSLSIVATPRLDVPPASYRERSAQLATRFQPNLRGTAIVILSKGAAAVITRTYLAAHALIVKQSTPQEVFRELGAAVQWVQALPDQAVDVKTMTKLPALIESFLFPPK